MKYLDYLSSVGWPMGHGPCRNHHRNYLRFQSFNRPYVHLFPWVCKPPEPVPSYGVESLMGLEVIGSLIAFIGLLGSLANARTHNLTWPTLYSLYVERILGSEPRITDIDGGSGLFSLLRWLKYYTSNITAVVTVAGDGGSSGRLRIELGILPPVIYETALRPWPTLNT